MRVTFKDRWNKVNFVEQKNNQDNLGNQQQHSAIESQTNQKKTERKRETEAHIVMNQTTNSCDD